MRVLVVFLSRHRLALATYEKNWKSILDKDRMPKSISHEVSFTPLAIDPTRADGRVFADLVAQEYLRNDTNANDTIAGVAVLYEAEFRGELEGIRDAIFAGEVPGIGYVENIQNFLIGRFNRLLGNYGVLMQQMRDSKKFQAASLPLHNFHATEFRQLIELCRNEALDPNFPNAVVPRLNSVMRLRGPKRRSKFPHVYFQDESRRYFKLGHERHSKYETGVGHNAACLINGALRFGGGLDQERHFNVSIGDSDDDARISCNLPNCHGAVVDVNRRTHINMFSNDFHR